MSGVVIPLRRETSSASLAKVAVLREELTKVLKGKDRVVESILCAIFSSGHILLEDVPGVGKTTVIKAVARLLGLDMKRIQSTSDLLPSDIIGVEVFDSEERKFVFHQGPLFTQIVLADELNRASPRTQSALLEAMGEGMVTVDRKTYELPKPFIVFAAQNPSDHIGTYPLPESQLDRFSIRIQIDYPSPEKELEIFTQASLSPLASLPENCLSSNEVIALQGLVDAIHVAPRTADYVKRFVDATRKHPSLRRGVSTRGGVTWLRLAKARAMMADREYVIPDDLVTTAVSALSHRIIPYSGNDPKAIVEGLLGSVDVEA